jgi:hypothetical protein
VNHPAAEPPFFHERECYADMQESIASRPPTTIGAMNKRSSSTNPP